jgi:hypothetical protein
MTDEQIQALILAFLDQHGAYPASTSTAELFLMVKQAVAAERERAIRAVTGAANGLSPDASDQYYDGYKSAIVAALAAIRAAAPATPQ